MHGSPQVPTPAIDEIARTGVRLDNYHTQPVCSPSRSTIFSGRCVMMHASPSPCRRRQHHLTPHSSLTPLYTSRHAIHHGVYMPFPQGSPLRLNINYTLLPSYLKTCCGYDTHMGA